MILHEKYTLPPLSATVQTKRKKKKKNSLEMERFDFDFVGLLS